MTSELTADTIQQRIRDLIKEFHGPGFSPAKLAILLDGLERLAGPAPTHVTVELFRASGKYYTEEPWRIPEGAIGPYDMRNSPDFRRISDGPVLIPAQEPWGFPYLIMPE